MKSEFKLCNVIGSFYRNGNVIFTAKNELFSPVGNRVTLFDLEGNTSVTFPFENSRNIGCIALSPTSTLLLSVDEDGRGILLNVVKRVVLYHFNFGNKVEDVKFSPCGKYFGVAIGNHVEVWRSPKLGDDLEFSPFVRHRVYTGHHDTIKTITWSSDSRFFLTASKDITARLYSLDPMENFTPMTFAGHREALVDAFFYSTEKMIYTASKDGALFYWEKLSPSEEIGSMKDQDLNKDFKYKWNIKNKHYFNQNNAKMTCIAFHHKSNLLVAGFTSGIFGLYELPEFNMIHTLSISQNAIDFISINKTGEWIAFCGRKLGQLLVWEWQSESYVLKQQGHFDIITDVVYTPDSQSIVTCSDDGKIKLWDIRSGFCLVTFAEHKSTVTGLDFSKFGNVLFSSSLDGSVRAWDLTRYRNFRIFVAPTRIEFSCLAVEPSGEIVSAGSHASFDIYIWSVQTGQLVDRLSGHEGPVSSLSFSNTGEILASGSWDKTVRLWEIFTSRQSVELLQLQSDVLAVAFRPDGKYICVSTLDGQLTFWDVDKGNQVNIIDGKKDISGGRNIGDQFSSANSFRNKSFKCICYSPDGHIVVAGGNSKYICIYDIESSVLIKKIQTSKNLSLDGTQEFLNSKNFTEAGPLELIDIHDDDDDDFQDKADYSLPGATKSDLSARKFRPEIRTRALGFSPNGRSFAAATTEGTLIYSLDDLHLFDPYYLDIEITPQTIRTVLLKKDYLKAMIMAFRLNEQYIIHEVYESIPFNNIELISRELPVIYLDKLLKFISIITESSPHIEFHLFWIEALFTHHGKYIKSRNQDFIKEIRAIQKYLIYIQHDIIKISDENKYFVEYILNRKNINYQTTSLPKKSDEIHMKDVFNDIQSTTNHINNEK
ncbi:hypothetical protein T552_00970 [Pneumocystis carinii B80]|uniref:Small-subunit processome Utp12 domain-containing protein n=1 Tax=Pneumocystis carinii (strain B80) TaxID=1408658 RepID=A0A0W4ZN18_PNEC8|nr:hypothetical protein T552_00970 [Pneumocystis carinii B80]KTW29763.1 hypothetical protein T552_00970 [Pneumocystis carinii B80]